MEAFFKNNYNKIIGYLAWVVSCVFAFISLNALIALLTRLFTYFWAGTEVPRFFLFLRQVAILPVGLIMLVLVRLGYDVVSKNADSRPDRIWQYYMKIIALEFAVLYLAAKI